MHVLASVGWFGAVLATLVLGVVALSTQDAVAVRAAYVALELIARFALVPLGLLSLLSGVVQSLGTTWGLLRHYWVIFKLVLNVVASVVLLMYLQTLDYLANQARAPHLSLEALRDPSPVLHASGALVLLAGAAVLSVYKPKGLTRRGQRSLAQGV